MIFSVETNHSEVGSHSYLVLVAIIYVKEYSYILCKCIFIHD